MRPLARTPVTNHLVDSLPPWDRAAFLPARSLQEHHLIRYHRGEIQVMDRSDPIEASCDCYASDRRLYRRVITQVSAA